MDVAEILKMIFNSELLFIHNGKTGGISCANYLMKVHPGRSMSVLKMLGLFVLLNISMNWFPLLKLTAIFAWRGRVEERGFRFGSNQEDLSGHSSPLVFGILRLSAPTEACGAGKTQKQSRLVTSCRWRLQQFHSA